MAGRPQTRTTHLTRQHIMDVLRLLGTSTNARRALGFDRDGAGVGLSKATFDRALAGGLITPDQRASILRRWQAYQDGVLEQTITAETDWTFPVDA